MRAVRVKETTHTERLHYLDWLRVIAVLGVVYAHTTNISNQLYWHVRGGDQNAGLIVLVVFGTQWAWRCSGLRYAGADSPFPRASMVRTAMPLRANALLRLRVTDRLL